MHAQTTCTRPFLVAWGQGYHLPPRPLQRNVLFPASRWGPHRESFSRAVQRNLDTPPIKIGHAWPLSADEVYAQNHYLKCVDRKGPHTLAQGIIYNDIPLTAKLWVG